LYQLYFLLEKIKIIWEIHLLSRQLSVLNAQTTKDQIFLKFCFPSNGRGYLQHLHMHLSPKCCNAYSSPFPTASEKLFSVMFSPGAEIDFASLPGYDLFALMGATL